MEKETDKIQTSVRLSAHGKTLLDGLSDELGLSQAGVIELALRELAKKWDLAVTKSPVKSKKGESK